MGKKLLKVLGIVLLVIVVAAGGFVVGMFAAACGVYLLWAGIGLVFVLAVYYTMHLM